MSNNFIEAKLRNQFRRNLERRSVVFGIGYLLGAVGEFGAQNCQPALNLNRSTKFQVCTTSRLTQIPC